MKLRLPRLPRVSGAPMDIDTCRSADLPPESCMGAETAMASAKDGGLVKALVRAIISAVIEADATGAKHGATDANDGGRSEEAGPSGGACMDVAAASDSADETLVKPQGPPVDGQKTVTGDDDGGNSFNARKAGLESRKSLIQQERDRSRCRPRDYVAATDNAGKLLCSMCDKPFASLEQLRKHLGYQADRGQGATFTSMKPCSCLFIKETSQMEAALLRDYEAAQRDNLASMTPAELLEEILMVKRENAELRKRMDRTDLILGDIMAQHAANSSSAPAPEPKQRRP